MAADNLGCLRSSAGVNALFSLKSSTIMHPIYKMLPRLEEMHLVLWEEITSLIDNGGYGSCSAVAWLSGRDFLTIFWPAKVLNKYEIQLISTFEVSKFRMENLAFIQRVCTAGPERHLNTYADTSISLMVSMLCPRLFMFYQLKILIFGPFTAPGFLATVVVSRSGSLCWVV